MLFITQLFTAAIASAQAVPQYKVILGRINTYIINPAIVFLFSLALVFFIYGVVEYLAQADKADARAKGQQHMIWGLVGIAIMFGVFGILNLIVRTFGFTSPAGSNILSF